MTAGRSTTGPTCDLALRGGVVLTSLEDFARDTASKTRTDLPRRCRRVSLDRARSPRRPLGGTAIADDVPLPLFEAAVAREQPDENAEPPQMPLPEQVSPPGLPDHSPVAEGPSDGVCRMFAKERVVPCKDISHRNDRRKHVRCAGVVLVRQRPGSAKGGLVFMTLEDETGIANIVVWPKVMEKYRKEVMGARLILVEGYIQSSPEG